MKTIKLKWLVLGLVIIGVLLWGASWYVASAQKDIATLLELRVTEQEKTLVTLAEIIERNGADQVVGEIIKDCAPESRERFDGLLDRLATLRGSELVEVSQLFEGCAGFFAERKAVMVARLEREVEVYSDLVEVYEEIDSRAPRTLYRVEEWQQLVSLESARSDLLNQQVILQKDIIDTLLTGVRANDPAMESKLTEASNIIENFSVLSIQIDQLRMSLVDV